MVSDSLFGTVVDVADSNERRIVQRNILQNTGFAGYFEGITPFTSRMKNCTVKQLIYPFCASAWLESGMTHMIPADGSGCGYPSPSS